MCDISHVVLLVASPFHGDHRAVTITDSYLSLSARTGRFSFGAPRAISLNEDGTRLLLLRSSGPEDRFDRLHLLDLATGAEREVADPTVLAPGRTGSTADLPDVERRLRASGPGSPQPVSAPSAPPRPRRRRLRPRR